MSSGNSRTLAGAVAVRLESVTKKFGAVTAVDSVSLDVSEGELFFLLGPSGCGKTTILRTIAGFEQPDSGRVYFDERDITSTPPHRRNTGMVFQNYALWPHMTVFENVAYGLRVRRVAAHALGRQVAQALDMVAMTPQRERFPNQLSGGQQQRVAVARALVINPGCLLLDDPLSNLDAKLRLEMREEIRRIHRETGVTTIYVTHDQKEALSMARRLAVLSEGRLVQVGTPEEVYRRPASAFVAAFVGETNLLAGTLMQVSGDSGVVRTDVGDVRGILCGFAQVAEGRECTVSIRPEDIEPAQAAGGANSFDAKTVRYTFLGDVGQYVLRVGPSELKALVVAPSGREVVRRVSFPPERVLVFPAPDASTGGGDAG
ncbi:MAG: ABC transporter ATP-binding protein [Planctomycetes bacterium]|nr:ABC transporter ATP-binding protein [Planctomycetota bacterium]